MLARPQPTTNGFPYKLIHVWEQLLSQSMTCEPIDELIKVCIKY